MLKQDQTQHTINAVQNKRLTCSDGTSFYAFLQLVEHPVASSCLSATSHDAHTSFGLTGRFCGNPRQRLAGEAPAHPDGAPGAPMKRYLSHISWSFAVAFYCRSATQITRSNRSWAPPMCTRTQINGNRVNITQQTSQTEHLFNNGKSPFYIKYLPTQSNPG